MNIDNLFKINIFRLKIFIFCLLFFFIITFIITKNKIWIIIAFFLLTIICFSFYIIKDNNINNFKENFTPSEFINNSNTDKIIVNTSPHPDKPSITLKEVLNEDYYKSNWKNPFGNLLLPEIKYDTERESAPPSFNLDVKRNITENIKKTVQKLNPQIKNTNKQLFGDLYNKFLLDNSNRVFYSMPNTRVENDQSAFANFLYHDLIFTGKESTVEGGIARIQDNYRYILY